MNYRVRLISIVMILLNTIIAIHAEDTRYNTKFGKPTKEEMSMTVYAPDSTAEAVYLAKMSEMFYTYDKDKGFMVTYIYKNRIKVLKPEGKDWADIAISYNKSKEDVFDIGAMAFNMENGKLVKTKLDKKYMFSEQLGGNRYRIKFSIPDVKVGTVIEYKYRIVSSFATIIKDIYVQSSIPVLYAKQEAVIPSYFRFAVEARGLYPINAKREHRSVLYKFFDGLQSTDIACRSDEFTLENHDIPAIKKDNYIWCLSDVMAHMMFNISAVEIPGSVYKNISHTWKDVEKFLTEDETFGGYMTFENPFKQEMATLGLDKLVTKEEKVAALFTLLQSKMKWNEEYGISVDNLKKDIKNASGTNASFNFVLMSMMRDAGIESYPVLLSNRRDGRLSIAQPMLSSITTFVIGFTGSDGKNHYIDASSGDGYVDYLPYDLCTDVAYTMGGGMVDLSKIGNNSMKEMVTATIDEEGVMSGDRSIQMNGQYAADYRSLWKKSKNENSFIAKLAEDDNATISDFSQTGQDRFSKNVELKYHFTSELEQTDDRIYVNPMLIADYKNNPFQQVKRDLPVEMPCPKTKTKVVSIKIPEGYEVEEMPQSANLKIDNDGAKCSYIIELVDGNTINLKYTFTLKTLLYASTNYPQLHNFWSLLTDKNNEMVVLRKKR